MVFVERLLNPLVASLSIYPNPMLLSDPLPNILNQSGPHDVLEHEESAEDCRLGSLIDNDAEMRPQQPFLEVDH